MQTITGEGIRKHGTWCGPPKVHFDPEGAWIFKGSQALLEVITQKRMETRGPALRRRSSAFLLPVRLGALGRSVAAIDAQLQW